MMTTVDQRHGTNDGRTTTTNGGEVRRRRDENTNTNTNLFVNGRSFLLRRFRRRPRRQQQEQTHDQQQQHQQEQQPAPEQSSWTQQESSQSPQSSTTQNDSRYRCQRHQLQEVERGNGGEETTQVSSSSISLRPPHHHHHHQQQQNEPVDIGEDQPTVEELVEFLNVQEHDRGRRTTGQEVQDEVDIEEMVTNRIPHHHTMVIFVDEDHWMLRFFESVILHFWRPDQQEERRRQQMNNDNDERQRQQNVLFRLLQSSSWIALHDLYDMVRSIVCQPIFDSELALIEFTVGLLMIERMLARLAESVVTIIVVSKQQQKQQKQQYQQNQHRKQQLVDLIQEGDMLQEEKNFDDHDSKYEQILIDYYNDSYLGGSSVSDSDNVLSSFLSRLLNFSTKLHFGRKMIYTYDGNEADVHGHDLDVVDRIYKFEDNKVSNRIDGLATSPDQTRSSYSSYKQHQKQQQQIHSTSIGTLNIINSKNDGINDDTSHINSMVAGLLVVACVANTAYFHSLMSPLYGRILTSIQQRRRQGNHPHHSHRRRLRQQRRQQLSASEDESSAALLQIDESVPSRTLLIQPEHINTTNINNDTVDDSTAVNGTSDEYMLSSSMMMTSNSITDTIDEDEDRNHEYNTEVLLCFLLVVLFVLEALMVLSVMVVGGSALVFQQNQPEEHYHHHPHSNSFVGDDYYNHDIQSHSHPQHPAQQSFRLSTNSKSKFLQLDNVFVNSDSNNEANYSVVIMGDLVVIFGIIWTMCVLSSTLVRVGLYQLLGGE